MPAEDQVVAPEQPAALGHLDVGDRAVIAAGRLVRVLADWPSPAAAIHALYPTSRHLSAKVRSFVDYLGDHLRAADVWH